MTRQHVLQAIAEHDERGDEAFLALYGFSPAPEHVLVHEGRSYDAAAVVGVAHRQATGRLATPEEVHRGIDVAVAILRKRGFEVSEPFAARFAPRAAPARAPRAPRTRTTTTRPTPVAERPVAICPTCSMTLPATGICDTCS
ncbi:hypothetical protein [Actinotalea ferrariae]|uniref:hypothetical protein n=1 Tax=Actinotalea ferrariae TaxID=1386098 RepID=UPI0021AB1D56|nr:hypothetical protein [Actinotalea ferrariae]